MSGARRMSARMLTTTALLGAISSVLLFLNFALPIFPAFIKMDISDAPALIASFAVGPQYGVLVELVKNLINLTHTSTGGVGELANFTIGCAYVLPAGLIYKKNRTLRAAVRGMIVGILSLTIAAALMNYFVLIPLYSKFMPLETIISMYRAINPYADTLGKVVLMSIVPFNLLKGTITAILTFALYKRLSPILKF